MELTSSAMLGKREKPYCTAYLTFAAYIFYSFLYLFLVVVYTVYIMRGCLLFSVL